MTQTPGDLPLPDRLDRAGQLRAVYAQADAKRPVLCGYVNERLRALDISLTPCTRPYGHAGFHFHNAL